MKWLLILPLFLVSCTSSVDVEISKAQKASSNGLYQEAILHYDRIIKRDIGSDERALASARDAAKIAQYETKDYKKAAEFYKYLVLYSKKAEERLNAQKQIAALYFEQLNDYDRSIIEYNRLLEMPHNKEVEAESRMNIARAYYYKNNFFQAESEVDELLKKNELPEKLRFDLLSLKGSIYMTQKELNKAIQVYQDLIKKFPVKASEDSVGLSLALCYEEQKDYNKAVEVLEELRTTYSKPEYIDIRIKRLKERQDNLPGAKGLRK